MSGCERGWSGYPFYPYPSPHQAQWSHHHPSAVDYCGVSSNNPVIQQPSHYVGYNDQYPGFVGSVIPSCPSHYWDGDNLVDAFGCIVKRKSSANKKERRRTESINNAFAELRECIPNVPADTKLSKIKTLRLATSYIAYLMGVLRTDVQDQPSEAFRAELPPRRKHNSEAEKDESGSDMEADGIQSYSDESPTSSFQYSSLIPQSPASLTASLASIGATLSTSSGSSDAASTDRRKSRTGWPEAVWAKELKF